MCQRMTHLLLLLCCLCISPAFSQNTTLKVNINETPHREPLNVLPGQTRIQLCGLTPGNTYQVIAVGAYPGQEADFSLTMAAPQQESVARPMSRTDRPELRRFKAAASCVDLLVQTKRVGPSTDVPMSLSVGCLDCPDSGDWRQRFVDNLPDGVLSPNLTVTQGNTAADLVTNVLIGGNCFDVSGITSKGVANSRGTFSTGQSSINISNGIVLCTGPTSTLPGPNNLGNTNGGFANDSQNDPNLSSLTLGNQYDVSVIEFDFRPTSNMVQFEFVFGSEEYCEFVNSQYNDAFGFFISGPGITGVKNLAVIPNTTTPVSVNNVNHVLNKNFYINNNKNYPCDNQTVFNSADIQLDGFTKVLTATANLIPCQTYHIKLAIADIADANYTSAVFLRANSFDAGGVVKATPVYPSAQPSTMEGCNNGYIRFFRGSGDMNVPLQVTYTLAPGNTATPGVDFMPIPTSLTIPAGQNEILVPIDVMDDQIPEGNESFKLLLDNACSCLQQDVTFVIQDRIPLNVDMEDKKVCTGSANLTPVLLSGGLPPLTYLWSSGQTTPNLPVSTFGSQAFTVTVTDVCGFTATASATATVDQTPTAILAGGNIQFCEGGAIDLPINFTGIGPWIVGMTVNGTPQTQTFTTNPGLVNVTSTGSYTLTSVVSQGGCPGLAGGNASIAEVSLGLNVVAQNPLCFGASGALKAEVGGDFPPYTFVWSTGASGSNLNNIPTGSYTVTVTTPQGCSATATASLTEPPILTAAVSQFNDIDCYRPEGNVTLAVVGGTPGYQYLWSNGAPQANPAFTAGGAYNVTVSDIHQCTAVASVTIGQNTTPPTVVAAAKDEISCNTPEVSLSSVGSSMGGNFKYSWSTPDGHILTGSEEPALLVDAPGTYILLITNTSNGCTATAEALVTENTNYPTSLQLSVTQPGCNDKPGAIQVLSVDGGEGPYVFSMDGGITFLNNSTFGSLAGGQYTLRVQDVNGCEYEQNVELIAPVEPTIDIAPEISLAYGDSTMLEALLNLPMSDLDTIIWGPLSHLTLTVRPNEVMCRPFKSTRYSVLVIAKNGCEDRAEVLVRVGDPDIYVPNVFSPSKADGSNDIFQFYARDLVINEIKNFQIFDRWGTQVFARDHFLPNDDRTGGWDGRYKGKLLPPGVFSWWAEVELASGEMVQMKGDVTLLD